MTSAPGSAVVRCSPTSGPPWPIDREKSLRVQERLEAELLVQAVGIGCREQHPPQSPKVRMVDNGLDERLSDAVSAVLANHEHIAEIGEHRMVGDDARETDLGIAEEGAEAKGVGDRTLDRLAGPAGGPVRLGASETRRSCRDRAAPVRSRCRSRRAASPQSTSRARWSDRARGLPAR